MTHPVSVSFAALNIDCTDSDALAGFWGNALGRPVSPGKVAGDTAVDAAGHESGPRMIFHTTSEVNPANNRFRPILVTEHYDEEIERLTGLGAKPVNEVNLPEVRWTTLADPEGNEFDLVTWRPA
ncbi:VOC family protein [Streptomyces sp. NPDC048254]|uniref:VOC family protein n=1 Tax=Streptomyces sp. NPDC048254 TaxID=3365525 RepID=UPI00371F38EA